MRRGKTIRRFVTATLLTRALKVERIAPNALVCVGCALAAQRLCACGARRDERTTYLN
jgi:hypothetical protein